MRFFKNYLYNKKLRAENIYQAQKDINRIALSVLGLLTAFKEAGKKSEERHEKRTELLMKQHKELMEYLDGNFKYFGTALGELMELLKVNDEQLTRQIFELKESLDNFLQSQAGVNNIIKKFFKMEIDNAMAESVTEKEEPTEHDKRF